MTGGWDKIMPFWFQRLVKYKLIQGDHWWSDSSTTPHDEINLWSPICYTSTPFGVRGGRVWIHSIAHSCVPPISSPMTHMVYLLPCLSYKLAPKAFLSARPSDPDMMTNTAPEAIASSSGKKGGKYRLRRLSCHISREPFELESPNVTGTSKLPRRTNRGA